VYDLKTEIKKKDVKKREPTKAEHDKPFKPSHPPRIGHNKTLAGFPEYKENPLKFVTRKRPVEGEEEKPAMKKTHNYKSRPTPSV